MRKYLQVSYYTPFGIKNFIDLGDFSYGEWIVCEDKIPKYHIIAFPGEGLSNALVSELLSTRKESMNSIIEKIGKEQGIKLSFQGRPKLEIVRKSELVELDLIPLPYEWVKQLS